MPQSLAKLVASQGLQVPAGAAGGKVLTSDASGNAAWADGVPGPTGPTGDTGPQGPQGIQGPGAGTRIYAGNGPPPLSLGIQGDWYQDRLTNALYGPKDVWADNPLNKHPNPSFEDDPGGVGITASIPAASGVLERTQAWAQHGTSSLHCVIVRDAATNNTINTNGSGLAGIPVDPAKTYSVQLHHRLRNTPPFTTGGVTLRIAWYKADGTSSALVVTGPALGYKTGVAGDVLVLQGLNATPPADAAFARVLMYSPQGIGTWDSDTDNIVFVEGATLPLSWPQTPTIGGVGTRIIPGQGAPPAATGVKGDWWLDTQTNTLYGPKATYPDTPGQMVPNPSVETDLSGWFTTASTPVGGRIFARENAWAVHGSWSLHSVITRLLATTVGIQPCGDGLSGIPVDPAKKYSFQVTQRLRRATAAEVTSMGLALAWYDTAGTLLLAGSPLEARSGAAGDVLVHTHENLTPQATSGFVRPYLRAAVAANGTYDTDVDSFLMFEGTTLPVSWPATGIDLDAVSGPAGGDLGGTYPNPTVLKAQAGFTVGGIAAALTNDARLSDSRAPSGAAAGDLSGSYPNPQLAAGVIVDADVNAAAAIAESKLALASDAAAGTASRRTLGSGAQQATAGNDSRLSDARAPTVHKATHEPGGSDPLIVDAVAGVGSLRTLGTGAQQSAAGNDTRLSDSRAPSGGAGGDLSGTYPNPTVVKAAGDFTVGSGLIVPTGAGAGKLLMSDASGRGAWADPGDTEFHYQSNGWATGVALVANTWTTLKPLTGSTVTTPAGAFTENADGSITVRDAGFYQGTVIAAFSAVAARADISMGLSGPATENFSIQSWGSADRGPLLTATGVLKLAAGQKVWVTAKLGLAGNALIRHMSLTRVGAGPQGPQGPQGSPGLDGGITPLVSALPGSPVDGQEVLYQSAGMATDGIVWHLRYRSAVSKWEYIGGNPWQKAYAPVEVTAGVLQAWIAFPTPGPIVTVPLTGSYRITWGYMTGAAATGAFQWKVGLKVGAATPVDPDDTTQLNAGAQTGGAYFYSALTRTVIRTGLAAGTRLELLLWDAGQHPSVYHRILEVTPVQVA